ncbi:MAG: ABC transporter permease [Balneolaceae bacterium]|nr:ABC transporter permease [Balneolaceae bacterium]
MVGNIVKLGWKNVWRNPTRSLVVVIAVSLGTWAGIFSAGFFNGMMEDSMNNQINLSVGHIQIMHPRFDDLYHPKYSIPHADSVAGILTDQPYVEQVFMKSVVMGLAQSPRNGFGVTINGITPQTDSVAGVEEYLVEGTMPVESARNPVLIGIELAKRLDLDMKSRMVLSFQDVHGEITGGAFRVAGIFDTFNDGYDENTVFVFRDDLNRLIGDAHAIHNIRVDTDDLGQARAYVETLSKEFPGLEIKAWGDLAPELQYVYDMRDFTMYIVMIIIIIGLVFSIINTMLMAVLERTRELGMLRAIGMNKARTFSMVMWETVFLTMVGAPAGLLLGWSCVRYFGSQGIDLSAFAQGLGEYGMSTMIYPSLGWAYYTNIVLMIAVAAILSALYPAWRTLKLRPVEAIRKFN